MDEILERLPGLGGDQPVEIEVGLHRKTPLSQAADPASALGMRRPLQVFSAHGQVETPFPRDKLLQQAQPFFLVVDGVRDLQCRSRPGWNGAPTQGNHIPHGPGEQFAVAESLGQSTRGLGLFRDRSGGSRTNPSQFGKRPEGSKSGRLHDMNSFGTGRAKKIAPRLKETAGANSRGDRFNSGQRTDSRAPVVPRAAPVPDPRPTGPASARRPSSPPGCPRTPQAAGPFAAAAP